MALERTFEEQLRELQFVLNHSDEMLKERNGRDPAAPDGMSIFSEIEFARRLKEEAVSEVTTLRRRFGKQGLLSNS